MCRVDSGEPSPFSCFDQASSLAFFGCLLFVFPNVIRHFHSNPTLALSLCVGLCCMRFHSCALRYFIGLWLKLCCASCKRKSFCVLEGCLRQEPFFLLSPNHFQNIYLFFCHFNIFFASPGAWNSNPKICPIWCARKNCEHAHNKKPVEPTFFLVCQFSPVFQREPMVNQRSVNMSFGTSWISQRCCQLEMFWGPVEVARIAWGTKRTRGLVVWNPWNGGLSWNGNNNSQSAALFMVN